MINRRFMVSSSASFLAWAAGGALAAPALDVAPVNAYLSPRTSWCQTPGGGRGKVVKVTNLDPSGPGSLRAALDQPFARIIVFEVGGVIDLAGASIKIRFPYVTIAGQTAPSPGVTIIRGKVSISTHDVIMQHLSFRPGRAGNAPGSGWDADGLTLYGAHDVIIDHCSFSWATDENLSVSGSRFDGPAGSGKAPGAPYNVIVTNSIIAEALMNATHRKGAHSKGLLIHDNAENVLVMGNVFASNDDRNALFKGGSQGAFVNNVVVNPGATALTYNLSQREWQGQVVRTGRLSVIGNVYTPGADTRKNLPFLRVLGEGPVEVFADDNARITPDGRLEDLADATAAPSPLIKDLPSPYLPTGIKILPSSQVRATVFATAGARPWDRDAIDSQILARAQNGTTRIIDSEDQGGGYPAYKPTKQPFKADDWVLQGMQPRPRAK